MKSILSAVFNVSVQILQNPKEGEESKIWFKLPGIPGLTHSVGFQTQMVGVKDSIDRVFNYLADMEAWPSHNDAIYQEVANTFKSKLMECVSRDTLADVFHKAAVAENGMFYCEIEGVVIQVFVTYEYPLYFSSQKFKATLDLGKFVALQITEPMSLDDIFQTLETIKQPTGIFAYHLCRRETMVGPFIQLMHAPSEGLAVMLNLETLSEDSEE